MDLPYLQVVTQRHKTDCGVACLAMLVGKSYEEVVMAFHDRVLTHGSTNRQVMAASRRLGYPLKWARAIDLETDIGILMVQGIYQKGKKPLRMCHLVLLKEGMIFDTDGTAWDVEAYVAAFKVKVLSLITRRD